MMVVTRRGYSLAGLTMVLVLHAFLLYLLLLERAGTENTAAKRYSQLLFIIVPPSRPAVDTPEPFRLPPVITRPKQPTVNTEPAAVPSPQPAETPPLPSAPADPFNDTAPINIGNLIKQAGKADRETRSAREMQAYGPAPGSMKAVMTKAFTEARLAVPLKWYEAARISEVTPPGARKPIYQVKTAFGTYCLYYPDKLTEGTGQPRMADCPRSMGQ